MRQDMRQDMPQNVRHDTVVVGAGQAGLAASWWLGRRGVDHAVFERSRWASAGARSAGTPSGC